MDFITTLLASVGLGYIMFQVLKALIAYGYRNANAKQAAIDAEIDRLHK
jgi:hypothetical protein